MKKGIVSKNARAHGPSGGHIDLSEEFVSSEVGSRYSEAFLSYDETSSDLSYESEELTFESKSTYSSSESNGCSTYSSETSNSYTSNSTKSSSDLVHGGGKYSGLSHFEDYCKKRQRRAKMDGIIEKLMKNNQVSPTENMCEKAGTTSFQEEYKEANRSPLFIVKGLKAQKKFGGPIDGPKAKAPSCVVVTKLSGDEISILSVPAMLGKKETKKTSNETKQNIHHQEKDQSSYSNYTKKINPLESDDRMSSVTSIGVKGIGFFSDRLNEEHPVHLEEDCDDSHYAIKKQSNSSSHLLSRNSTFSQIRTENTVESEVDEFRSEDLQNYAPKFIAVHSLNNNKFLQINFRKFAKKSFLKLRGRKNAHLGRTTDDNEQTVDQKFEVVHDDLEINEDGLIKNQKIIYTKFGGDPVVEMKLIQCHEHIIPASNSSEVLVRIEASTVSIMDSKIRRSLAKLPFGASEKITPGIDVVGIVQKCGDEATTLYGINQNERVASLVGTGGNATFISLDASKVVRLPSGISAVSAAVVIETYLPAFQALVYDMAPAQRYSSTCLQGKSVLITGGISNLGQALIQLSLYFGAAKVYTTAILKHHALLRSQGAIPVDASPDTIWCEQIDSHIDLAISNHSLANIYDVMKFGGKIVFLGEGTTKLVGVSGSISDFIFLRIRGLSTFTYDMFYEWENDMERSKKDLSYLFGLLMLNRITPQVTRTMGLKNVPKAHVYLDSKKRVQGTMVCLPSNDDNLRLALSGEV